MGGNAVHSIQREGRRIHGHEVRGLAGKKRIEGLRDMSMTRVPTGSASIQVADRSHATAATSRRFPGARTEASRRAFTPVARVPISRMTTACQSRPGHLPLTAPASPRWRVPKGGSRSMSETLMSRLPSGTRFRWAAVPEASTFSGTCMIGPAKPRSRMHSEHREHCVPA